MVHATNEKDLDFILSGIDKKTRQLSDNKKKLLNHVKLLNQYNSQQLPENDVKLFVEYDSRTDLLNSLKFVTSEFLLAESADFKMHESGSGIEAIEGHVVYTLDLIAGNIVNEEGNSFPIYCEDKDQFQTNVLRDVGYVTSSCNCGPRQSTYGCPHVFSNDYSGGLGMELTIKKFGELGLNEKLMEEVETHIRTAYEKTDEELYARIGELRDQSVKMLNEMIAEMTE
jgi:hypothetical protein